MENIFLKYPEFIDTDIRINRPNQRAGTYKITPEFQYLRHKILMPRELCENQTVLDLGSCVGGTGAWALSMGAKKYVGIELQEKFFNLSVENLTKYFDTNLFEIQKKSFDDFFKQNNEKFDIVVALGSIYHSLDNVSFLKNIGLIANKLIVIDSLIPIIQRQLPDKIKNLKYYNFIKNLSITAYENGGMVLDEGGSLGTTCGYPSVGACEMLLNEYNFKLANNYTDIFGKLYPELDNSRYYITLEKTNEEPVTYPSSFEKALESNDKTIFSWNNENNENTGRLKTWKFDEKVADTFEIHALKHIPDYLTIIDKTIQICTSVVNDKIHDKVIDVGSAIGETIQRLYGAGYHNLVGVDSSDVMLSKIDFAPIAEWICSNEFPINNGPYKCVIMNWTLHFIQNKIDYLKCVYNGMDDNSVLVLTDKTCNEGIELEQYHDWKRSRGVTEEEIKLKADSVKDIMFINDVDWYLETLKQIGFKNIEIVHQVPCFTTFKAYK